MVVEPSKVRRHRMGHIELSIPVVHFLFIKGNPSLLATLLEMKSRDLEMIVNYDRYIVISSEREGEYKLGQLLTVEEFQAVSNVLSSDGFQIETGAEAIRKLLSDLNLESLSSELRQKKNLTKSKDKKRRLAKRLCLIEAFLQTGSKPEWLVLDVIPKLL